MSCGPAYYVNLLSIFRSLSPPPAFPKHQLWSPATLPQAREGWTACCLITDGHLGVL